MCKSDTSPREPNSRGTRPPAHRAIPRVSRQARGRVQGSGRLRGSWGGCGARAGCSHPACVPARRQRCPHHPQNASRDWRCQTPRQHRAWDGVPREERWPLPWGMGVPGRDGGVVTGDVHRGHEGLLRRGTPLLEKCHMMAGAHLVLGEPPCTCWAAGCPRLPPTGLPATC